VHNGQQKPNLRHETVGDKWIGRVTGQLADTPTRRMPTHGLDNSQTGSSTCLF